MQAFFEIVRDEDAAFYCLTHRNNRCSPHFHSNIEIAYVTSGNFKVTINGVEEILGPGDVSIAAGYDVHSYDTPDESEIKLLLIPVNFVPSFNHLIGSAVFKSHFLKGGLRSKAIFEAISRLEEFSSSKDSIIVKGYLYAILGYLIEQLGICESSESSGDVNSLGPIRDILLYIEENYLNAISVSSLAAHFGYNKDYLSRIFNSTLGCGFNHYINMIRARHAAALIHNSDMSITEISFASGFNNSRTFARAFQSLYGVTAVEYKKRRLPQTDMDREIVKFKALKN